MFVLHVLLSTLAVAIVRCNAQPVEQLVYETSLPCNFTLAATNKLSPNQNSTGVPLVLGQNGASTGITFHVTSTYASYPYDDYPSLFLQNSQMGAYDRYGRWITNATEVLSGGQLGWVTTTLYTAPAPQVYSALRIPGRDHPVLAVRGVADLWSLCPSEGNLPQTNVVFNVSALLNPPPINPIYGFNPLLCYPVDVNIVKVT